MLIIKCMKMNLREYTKNDNSLSMNLCAGSGSGYLTACMALMVGTSGHVIGIEKVQACQQAVTTVI
jgi:protein-L-isoaspartate O-methyltransferase